MIDIIFRTIGTKEVATKKMWDASVKKAKTVIPRGKNPVAGRSKTPHGHPPMLTMFNVNLPTSSLHLLGQKSLVTTSNSKMWLFTRTTKLALISSLITIQILNIIQIFLVFTNPNMQTGDILSVMEPASQQCLFYQARIDCTFAVPSVLMLITVGTQRNTKSARGSIWRFRNVLKWAEF